MKYLVILSLIAWLQLGASLASSVYSQRLAQLEERIQRLEFALVTQQKYDAETEEMATKNPVVVTGCGTKATEHLTLLGNEIIREYPSHITSVTVTCGTCSTLQIAGSSEVVITACLNTKGTVDA